MAKPEPAPPTIEEFHYRIPWKAWDARPGHHASARPGAGHAFHGYAPLLANRDPRRLDIRASLRDPFEQFQVRVYHQRGSIPVYALLDLSASMGFSGAGDKMRLAGDFAVSLAASAWRTGDAFGFIGCDDAPREAMFLPASRRRGIARELTSRLAELAPGGDSARGLLDAAAWLGKRRALVFVISDFHLPTEIIEQIFGTLSHHDVVPIVVWDSREFRELPDWGLIQLRDMETGARRFLLLRPGLRQRIEQAYANRRQNVIRACIAHGREPFFLLDRFNAGQLTRYFHVQ